MKISLTEARALDDVDIDLEPRAAKAQEGRRRRYRPAIALHGQPAAWTWCGSRPAIA